MDDRERSENGPTVVIVDDHEAIRTALGRLIRTIGYKTTVFSSAEELLSRLDELQPDCVLTDIQMPGMNGLDLATELHRRQRDIPIAIMTAYPSLANRELALAAGVSEYLTKPLDDQRLEAWLSQVVGPPPA